MQMYIYMYCRYTYKQVTCGANASGQSVGGSPEDATKAQSTHIADAASMHKQQCTNCMQDKHPIGAAAVARGNC
jgi:hypothetical protein